MVMLAYNLMSLFRHTLIGNTVQPKLSNCDTGCLRWEAYMVKESNHHILEIVIGDEAQGVVSWDFNIKHHISHRPFTCQHKSLLRNLG